VAGLWDEHGFSIKASNAFTFGRRRFDATIHIGRSWAISLSRWVCVWYHACLLGRCYRPHAGTIQRSTYDFTPAVAIRHGGNGSSCAERCLGPDEALADVALVYANQNERDDQAPIEIVHSGRIEISLDH
jgi:hypothetical protein